METNLEKCPACGREVSTTAENCPACGHVLRRRQTATGIMAAIIIGLVLGVLLLKGCGYL